MKGTTRCCFANAMFTIVKLVTPIWCPPVPQNTRRFCFRPLLSPYPAQSDKCCYLSTDLWLMKPFTQLSSIHANKLLNLSRYYYNNCILIVVNVLRLLGAKNCLKYAKGSKRRQHTALINPLPRSSPLFVVSQNMTSKGVFT